MVRKGEVFIYKAEVSSRVGRGIVDFCKLFTETNEQKFVQDIEVAFSTTLTVDG